MLHHIHHILLEIIQMTLEFCVGYIICYLFGSIIGFLKSVYNSNSIQDARVTFHWEEPCHVGSTLSFTVEVIGPADRSLFPYQ